LNSETEKQREKERKAALNIQTNWRMLRVKWRFKHIKYATIHIQKSWRGYVGRSIAHRANYQAKVARRMKFYAE
jgi:hypothetical protein